MTALVMPITLIGLHALSVEMPMTASTCAARRDDGPHQRVGAEHVGLHRLDREVLAGRHLLERRGVDHDVGVPDRLDERS